MRELNTKNYTNRNIKYFIYDKIDYKVRYGHIFLFFNQNLISFIPYCLEKSNASCLVTKSRSQ